ncbi:MAG TPA: phosphotransferase family protein [Dehalococcoidia bacterium]
MTAEEIAQKLSTFLQRSHDAKSVRVDGLRLLTGGASRQTWSFDATIELADGHSETLALIARADQRQNVGLMTRETEYRLLEAAHTEGVAVPRVHLMGDDSLGAPFFLMERVEGEAIARRILREDEFAGAREKMTAQLGEILATIHRLQLGDLTPALPSPIEGKSPAETELARIEGTFRSVAPEPHPAFELAIRWLKGHLPASGEPTLVHGDYRLGNLIIGPEGVRSVLDWELAHIGDPMEDLAWVCVRSWRFGNDDRPVAGVGQREDLFRAYEATGGRPVDPTAVHWWEVFGNLRWGIICIMQAGAYLGGLSKSVELATIGRRTAETEWELLNLLEGS